MKKVIVALLFAALYSASLFAAEQINLEKGGYFGLEAGMLKDPDSSDTLGVGRLFSGYRFNENASLEAGLYRSGDINGNGYSVYLWGFDGSLLLRPSISSGLNGLFGRIGLHQDYAHVSSYSNPRGWDQQWGGGGLIGLGYDLNFNKDLSARVSYTYLGNVAGSGYGLNQGTFGLLFNF